MNEIDARLDDIALKQSIWKNQKLLTTCLLIAEEAVKNPVFWPDALNFDFLLTDEDRNLIGSAWRICSGKLEFIEKTGLFQRSKKDKSNGRTIFQYRLTNRGLAMAFLKRYDATKHKALAHPQLDLFQ